MINALTLWAILLALTLEFFLRQHSYYFLLYSGIPILFYSFGAVQPTENNHCAKTHFQGKTQSDTLDLDELLHQWRELGSPYYLHCDYRLVNILHRTFELDGDTSNVDMVNRMLQYVESQSQTSNSISCDKSHFDNQEELDHMRDKMRNMYFKVISRIPSMQEYLFPYIKKYIE
jgi:hypothetical protein